MVDNIISDNNSTYVNLEPLEPIEPMYRVSQIATALNFTRDFLYYEIKEGRLKAVKIAKSWTYEGYEYRIRKSDLESWINNQPK